MSGFESTIVIGIAAIASGLFGICAALDRLNLHLRNIANRLLDIENKIDRASCDDDSRLSARRGRIEVRHANIPNGALRAFQARLQVAQGSCPISRATSCPSSISLCPHDRHSTARPSLKRTRSKAVRTCLVII